MSRIGSILLLLIACGNLLGCGGGSSTTRSGSTVSNRPAASASSSPATACREDMLQIRDAGSTGVAAGTFGEAIEFRSDRSCYLRGYPSVWLLSATGQRLAVVPRQRGLYAVRATVKKGHPVYADLYYENPSIHPHACRLRAKAMGIEPPGGQHRIAVKFKYRQMLFCPHSFYVSGFGGGGPLKS